MVKKKHNKGTNKGFTLVEIVVVVVILVVLAALIMPLFNRYFLKKYDDKIIEEAKDVMQSSQIVINELYANYTHNIVKEPNDKVVCFIEGEQDNNTTAAKDHPTTFRITDNNTMDCDIHKNPISKHILELCGIDIKSNSPCIILIGTGRYDIYADPNNELYDPIKAYTVYIVDYQPIFDEKVVFMMDEESSFSNPVITKKVNGKNTYCLSVNDEEIFIQFYALKTGKDNNMFMNTIWKYITKKYN